MSTDREQLRAEITRAVDERVDRIVREVLDEALAHRRELLLLNLAGDLARLRARVAELERTATTGGTPPPYNARRWTRGTLTGGVHPDYAARR